MWFHIILIALLTEKQENEVLGYTVLSRNLELIFAPMLLLVCRLFLGELDVWLKQTNTKIRMRSFGQLRKWGDSLELVYRVCLGLFRVGVLPKNKPLLTTVNIHHSTCDHAIVRQDFRTWEDWCLPFYFMFGLCVFVVTVLHFTPKEMLKLNIWYGWHFFCQNTRTSSGKLMTTLSLLISSHI